MRAFICHTKGMFRLVMILACLCEGRNQSHEYTPVMKRLPSIMQEFCPGVNICSTNRSVSTVDNSCCVECSCEADCTVEDNCCFPNSLSSDPVVKKENQENLKERSCLYLMSPQPQEHERIRHQSYYMVFSIGNPFLRRSNGLSNDSCGGINIAPWGSIYPFSSATTKQIYKNKECAQADGMADGVLWDVVLVCKTEDAFTATIGLEASTTFPENCVINFMYPGNLDEIESSKCYLPLIDTCPVSSEFQVPKGTNLSKSDIRSLCTSGLASPYQHKKMYANVFCHICNAEYFNSRAVCRKSDVGKKGITANGFVAILNPDYIAETNEINPIKEGPKVPLTCSWKNTSICREVFCPSGQLRNKKRICIYPTKLWYNQHYFVNINLTAGRQINVTDLFKVPPGVRTKVLPPLVSPWGQDWLIHKVFYKEMDIGHISDNFIMVGKHSPRINPRSIVKYIKSTVKKQWLVDVNNETVVLKSNFAKYTTALLFSVHKGMSLFKNNTVNSITQLYNLIYSIALKGQIRELTITKMYVCEQVELEQHEFILSQKEYVIFSYTTQRFLFDGEFDIIRSNTFDGIRARICIEDSGLHKMGGYSVRNTGTILTTISLNRFCVAIGLVLEVMFIKFLK